MKQTLFLATLLGASLGFSNVSWATYIPTLPLAPPDPDDFDHVLCDDEDNGGIIFDVDDEEPGVDYEDEETGITYYAGDSFLMPSFATSASSIRNGGLSGKIVIDKGASLYMDGSGGDSEGDWEAGELLFAPSALFRNDYDFPEDWDKEDLLHITMYDQSLLDYRGNDTYLGVFTFDEGAHVSIYSNNLHARDLTSEEPIDFTINAYINLGIASLPLVMNSQLSRKVTLCYSQESMNLKVTANGNRPHVDENGQFDLSLEFNGDPNYYRMLLNSENGAKFLLQNGITCNIDSYLGGTATISLGDNTTVQGFYGRLTEHPIYYFSWLTNNIEVRENCRALMTEGYYGGTITMQEGSSLKFDMLVAPAGVDEEHWNGGVKVDMNGGNTLDLAGKQTTLDLTVRGDGNTVTNGTLIGTLTLGENSYLYSDSAMASWNGPASIVMDEGSKLEMATGAGKDRWINDVSKLVVNGTATVVNAYLRIKPGETYTLGNGVQNLVGLERSFLCLDNSTLDLGNGEISKLAIGVWSAFDPYNVIKNGKINSYVEIDPSAKLSLQGVTIGDNASFTMKDNTLLDLGQAKEEYMVTVQTPTQTVSWLQERKGIGLNKFTFTGQSARIDNGTLWVGDHISGDNETVTLGTDLSGTAAMKLDYDQATLKFGGHKWTMTQSNGTELFTMEDNGGYTGAITGRAEIDVDSGTQDKNHVQFKGKAADRPDWVQVQGVKLTTKSDFHMENAVISGSLIDIGEGTTMYLVNVEIKADTRFTDDTAMLDMRNTTAWLEQDVNTYVTGREQMETDTVFSRCGNILAPTLTIAEGSKGINLTCDMFDSVTLDGTDLWLDMTDIAERGTLLGWDYFTLTFDSMTQEVEQALTYISTLQIFAKLREDYITNAYVSYSDYAEHDGRASRLFFKLVPTPEPTTGTLSLLALAALAARRRKR